MNISLTRSLIPFTTGMIVLFSVINTNAQSWNNIGTPCFAPAVLNTSAAIDTSGTPYVFFDDHSGTFANGSVMKFNGISWVNVGAPLFTSGQPYGAVMAIDLGGTPYVAYEDDGFGDKASVMKFNGTSWVYVGTRGISASSVGSVSLAIDHNGTPYVVYRDGANSYKASVMKYNGASWVYVGGAGFTTGAVDYTSIAIDSSGTPYIAFQDQSTATNAATVMKFDGTNWVYAGNPRFSAAEADYVSMALDTSGMPYVVYSDQYLSTLYRATVMRDSSNIWVPVGIEGFSAGYTQYTSIAIGHNDTVYVAYSDLAATQKTTVQKFNGTAWVNVGSPAFSLAQSNFNNIAIDPKGGAPYVNYQDLGCGGGATVMKFGIPPSAITGATSVCPGGSVTLSDATPGGVWTSSNTAKATVGASSGIVTPVAVGVTTIYYTVSGLSALYSFTVIPLANAGSIVGVTNGMCIGADIYLSDATGTGVWSSSNTGVATVNNGWVSGLAAGSSVISYAVTNTCNTAVATQTITVSPHAVAGTISGPTSECTFSTITLTVTGTGGTWSVDLPALATVNNSGIVSGLVAGVVNLTYTVMNSCDTAMASQVDTINTCTTGMETVGGHAATLVVSPNPNHGSFTLNISSAQKEEATITITNILGEKVKELIAATNTDTQVQINIPAGMYFVTAVTKSGSASGKVMVE